MEEKSLKDWFLECIYIQDNIPWSRWAGAARFIGIKQGLKDATGMSEDGFWAWLDRIKKYRPDWN